MGGKKKSRLYCFVKLTLLIFWVAGDMGFDDRNIIQDANMDDTLYKNPDSSNILLDDSLEKNQDTEKPLDIDFDAPQRDDEFGKEFDDFGMCSLSLLFRSHHHKMSRKSHWLITSKMPLKSKWIKNIDYFFIAESHP